MKKILVTGGCGYIGSHTLVDLVEKGFDVISIDNFSRSDKRMLEGVRQITGKEIRNYSVDLCDFDASEKVFSENKDITGIIHFAAYKAVGESVDEPLLYFRNNLLSLINLLELTKKFDVPYFIFSSSCSVYGNVRLLPVDEDAPIPEPVSPYARTKQMGEKIVTDFSHVSKTKFILLRYFNPVGAHPSSLIGELPIGQPSNLFPVITQTAIGKLKEVIVHGNDYHTPDGTCIRDYIHVMDIASAHSLALQALMNDKVKGNCEVFNLGTGKGYSVMEVINTFEKVSGKKLNYRIGPRRTGDVTAVYADNKKASGVLNWKNLRPLDEMILSAWNWEKKLAEEK